MRCPILLKDLTGYSTFNPMLNFDRNDFEISQPKKQQGMSISGYQPKLQLMITENQFDIIDSQGDYILKPSPNHFPFLAENEHATMQVMKALKFDVPANGLVYFKTEDPAVEKEFAFVIKRYDRLNNQSIHQEQLDGAMNIAEKYGKIKADGEHYISYERVIKFILEKVSQKNIVLIQDLFLRVVYAYLLGNNDLHLRNFSLILNQDNTISLAPIYDFVSVKPYAKVFNDSYLALPLLMKEEGGKELADGFETQYSCYLGMDFIEFGQNIGLSQKLSEQLLLDLVKQKEKIISIYQHSFMPQEQIEQVLQCYQQRLHYLQLFNEPKL